MKFDNILNEIKTVLDTVETNQVNEYCIKRVMILRGLIWLNMSPLHHKPFDYFLFYHGKLNLFKALNYES